jgi:hypothetical protein
MLNSNKRVLGNFITPLEAKGELEVKFTPPEKDTHYILIKVYMGIWYIITRCFRLTLVF